MITQQMTHRTELASRPLPRPRLAVAPTARPEITADTIARIGAWAKAHDTTFADLVYDWATRGGLRALARHIDLGDVTISDAALPQGA